MLPQRRSLTLIAVLLLASNVVAFVPGADAQTCGPSGNDPCSCPPGETGTPPNCSGATGGGGTCQYGGSYPNCNPPPSCQYGGSYPNCNPPPSCQYGGTYPNCNPPPSCQYGGTYPNCNPPPTTTCPSGQHLDNGNCVPDATGSCQYGGTYPNCNPPPTNTCQYGGTYPNCNPPPPNTCPSGQHMENGTCVPDSTCTTNCGGTCTTNCPPPPCTSNCPPPPNGTTGTCQYGGTYPNCNPPPTCTSNCPPPPNGTCTGNCTPPPPGDCGATCPPPCGGAGQPACPPPPNGTAPPPCDPASGACPPPPNGTAPPPCGGAGQPACPPPCGNCTQPPPCGGANQPPCPPPCTGNCTPPPCGTTCPPPGGCTGNCTPPPTCDPNQPCGPPPSCPPNATNCAPPPGGFIQCAPDQHVEGNPPQCVAGPPCDPQRAQCGPFGGAPCGGSTNTTCGPPPCAGGEPNSTAAMSCGGFIQCGPDQHIEGNPPHCVAGPPGLGPREAPGFCQPNADGTMVCKPPTDCAACRPPPNCTPQSDGSYLCKPGEGGPMGAPPCAPPPGAANASQPPQPCGPPMGCDPQHPCHADGPAFCKPQADGTNICDVPPDCAGKVGTTPACTPPPNCTVDGDHFTCKPFRVDPNVPCGPKPEGAVLPGSATQPCGPPPCPPPSPNASAPQPCGPGAGFPQGPACQPGANGTLNCAPPTGCGGAAFGAAAGDGCAPPSFCSQTNGTYQCKPPEDCRETAGGWQKCFALGAGAACAKALEDYAAAGQFTPCAAPPTAFCPPPPPGSTAPPTCRAPPAPPHACGPNEPQFPPNHPAGAPPVCFIPGGVRNGTYVPPGQLLANDCAPPPPGEWPPAQPAPAGKVWCPPQGYAPPPAKPEDLAAWKNFTQDHAPPQARGYLAQLGNAWAFNDSTLADISNASNAHQLFAPPQFDGRFVNGSFVQSRLGEDLRLQNFSVGGATFFRDARPLVHDNATFSTQAGPAVLSAGDKVLVETHNVPSGLLGYRAAGDDAFNVSFSPEDGYNVTKDADGLIILQRGDWRGVFVGDARIAANGSIDLNVTPENPGFFMAVPPGGLEEQTRLDIAKGVADDKVFAEVSLVERNDTLAQDLTVYAANASAFHVDVENTTDDVVNLTVSGEGAGQALVFTVDRSTLTTSIADFNVTIDGATVPECDTFAELEASAETGGCFVLNANETTLRVDVMPQHFSTHAISMGSVSPVTSTAASSTNSTTSTTTDETTTTTGSGSTSGSGASGATTTPTTTTPTTATTTTQPTSATTDTGKKTPGVGTLGLVAAAAVAIGVISLRKRRT